MVNHFFGTHFYQWWNGEKAKCNFCVGVNFGFGVNSFPRDNFPGGKLSLKQISSSWVKITRDMSRGTVPGVFVSRDNYWQHLTHYWDANFPRRCLGISWYFCTYDDKYFIILYAKVCIRYSMFLYIRLQYALVIWPNMSRGTRAPCGTPPPKKTRINTS